MRIFFGSTTTDDELCSSHSLHTISNMLLTPTPYFSFTSISFESQSLHFRHVLIPSDSLDKFTSRLTLSQIKGSFFANFWTSLGLRLENNDVRALATDRDLLDFVGRFTGVKFSNLFPVLFFSEIASFHVKKT